MAPTPASIVRLCFLALAWPALAFAQNVNVSVNAAQGIRTVDERVFGANSVIWDPQANSAQTISLLQQAGLRTVRVPGGSLSDEYHWRVNKTLNNTWTWSSHFGKFVDLISSLGANAMVTVNYGTGTPEEAAALVAYLNSPVGSNVSIGSDGSYNWGTSGDWASVRAAQVGPADEMTHLRIGRAAPLGARYFEIGNECYGTWETDQQAVKNDPTTYANRAAVYMEKMRAVDPTIKIGVVVVRSDENNSYKNWTPVMLARLKVLNAIPDFVIYHRYPQAPGGETDAGLLQQAAGNTSGWAYTANDLRTQVNTHLGASGAGVELVVTENNSVYSNPGKQSTSVVNGLFLADSIANVMKTEINGFMWWAIRNGPPPTSTTNQSASLYGWRMYGDYGMISTPFTEGATTYATSYNDPHPTYYAMKLLSQFARGGDTVVQATSSSNLLSVYAAKRANGAVTLLVINKSPAATQTGNFTLAGHNPAATATVYSYGIPQDEAARTGSGSPDIAVGSINIAGAAFTASFGPYSATVLSLDPAPTNVSPAITLQPASQSVIAGDPATFSAAASGAPAPTLQWQRLPAAGGPWTDLVGGGNYSSVTGPMLNISNTSIAMNGDQFRCVATNIVGSITSNAATLTIVVPPAISQQPVSQIIAAGQSATFTVTASGFPSPTYQWRSNGVNIPGATNSSYTIPTVTPAHAATYTVVVTNSSGSVTSNDAVLTVHSRPTIATEPASQTIVAGNPVTFTSAASGNPPPSFQWKKDNVDIGGATSNSYTIASVALTDAATYTVVATNYLGSATSNSAVLTVHVPPAITSQPVNQTANVGSPATFSVTATGTPAPAFQWKKAGVNIPGATNASYTIPSVARTDAGSYGVVVSNAAGMVFSNSAVLTVNYAPVFTAHPPTHFVTIGANVAMSVATDANPAATYQWKNGGVDIPGATSATYTVSNAQLADSGNSYTVVATNSVNSTTSNPGVLTVTVASITPVPADFNNDGKPDIVWRNINTGAIAFWFMNGTAMQSATVIGSVTSDWSIAGTGDFNNDGQTDLLWRKASTGGVAVWLMNGTAMQSAPLLANITADWRIDGTGDFNGDGKVDILWRKESSGAVALWLMDGIVIQSTPIIANITADWLIGGTGDFNGDNKVDILWRKESTGAVAFWLMDGVTISSTPVVANITADWKIAGSGDYNADGETDILWRKESTGLVAFWLMNDTAIQTTPVVATITADWVICN